MAAERHYGVERREITPILAERGTLTLAKPRRTVGKIWRSYRLRALGFVAFLVAWFLFWAVNVPGI